MIDVYRKKWFYLFGLPVGYTLEFVKRVKDKQRAKEYKGNKKYIL